MFVPDIVLVEMIYLIEREKLPEDVFGRLYSLLTEVGGSYALAESNPDASSALRRVPRSSVPDMPDRIITATALQLGLPLITRDEAIRRSGVVPVDW